MSITWTEDADSRQNLGPAGIAQFNKATFGASDYPTGGYTIPASAFGLSRIRGLIPCGFTGNARGYVWEYNNTNNPGTLQVYEQNGTTGALVETASNTDFSAGGGSITLRAEGY